MRENQRFWSRVLAQWLPIFNREQVEIIRQGIAVPGGKLTSDDKWRFSVLGAAVDDLKKTIERQGRAGDPGDLLFGVKVFLWRQRLGEIEAAERLGPHLLAGAPQLDVDVNRIQVQLGWTGIENQRWTGNDGVERTYLGEVESLLAAYSRGEMGRSGEDDYFDLMLALTVVAPIAERYAWRAAAVEFCEDVVARIGKEGQEELDSIDSTMLFQVVEDLGITGARTIGAWKRFVTRSLGRGPRAIPAWLWGVRELGPEALALIQREVPESFSGEMPRLAAIAELDKVAAQEGSLATSKQ